MNNLDYSKVFEVLVKETANYVKVNNLKAMVLGISGGIDSTVVAAICHEVSKQTGIPLIGRSLPIKNKSNSSEFSYRLAMCRMTFSSLSPEVYVNAVEKSMYVPSYSKGIPTYDVLVELKSQMPNNELVIITTPETYSEIPLWHNGSTILKDYKFIMVINGEEPPYGLPDNVSLVYVPTIRMCSTCIRNRVKDGVGIKPFVRDDVYEIIKQYKLYV